MTSERRLLIGFDDIRAITFECKKCGARLSIASEKVRPDDVATCPGCRETWIPGGISSGRSFGFPIAQFLALLPDLVKGAQPAADTRVGVRILFEIADSQ